MKPIQTNPPFILNWQRILIIPKSIILGFLVSTTGIAIWTADMMIFKLAPWSILFMLVPLGLYWRFFSGRSWPQSNAAIRKVQFRLINLSVREWTFGLLAGLLFVVIVQSCFVITFRIIPLPDSFSSQYKIIETLPTSLAWLAIAMSSLVAGICEEVGFRGYMQVPMEKNYGPIAAITIVSVIFTLVHLDRSWAASILPVIFFASVLLGILAYKTNSLIPGMIGHTILDVFDYSFWWTNLMGKFERQTIFVSGIDTHIMVWTGIFLASIIGFFWAIHKLK